MGRKAKIKKARKQASKQKCAQPQPKNDNTKFVRQLERQGYQLKNNIQRSPELPDNKVDPQL